MQTSRWFTSAAWACLAGIAGQFFIAVAIVGLFLLFFGAMLSAMLLPFLTLLPADWQSTGGQWLAAAAGLWIVLMVLSGATARWAWRRCAAVWLEAPAFTGLELPEPQGASAARPLVWSPAKRWSVLAGLFASLCFYAVVPAWLWSGVGGWVPPVPTLPTTPGTGTTV